MKNLKWRDGLIFFEEVHLGDPTKVPDPKQPPKKPEDEEDEENGETEAETAPAAKAS